MNGNISDASYWILKIMYVLFGTYIAISTYKNIKKNKKSSFFDFFNLFYFIVYCITPFFVLDEIKQGKPMKYLKTTEEKYYYFTFIATILVYFVIKITYRIFLKIKFKEKSHYTEINTNNNRFFIVNSVLLVFTWICLILWTYKFGSIFGIFKYASAIRDGTIDAQNKFAFLARFCVFFGFLTYNFIIILIDDFKVRSKRLPLTLICLGLSIFGTFIYAMNIDSRGYVVTFLLVLILYFFYKKIFDFRITSLIKIFCIAICIIVLVSRMDQITKFIKTGEVTPLKQSNFFIKEYSYVYNNVVNVFYMYDHKSDYNIKLRFLENIKEIPFAWIPMTMKPDDITDLNDYNTSFYKKETGELPADIVTASIYNFGYIGLIINPIIYGIIIAFMTKKMEIDNDRNKNKVQKIMYYYFSINLMGLFVTYVDIAPILTGYFGFTIFYTTIYLTCRQKKLKEKYLIDNNSEEEIQ